VFLHKSTSVATRELGFTVLERIGDVGAADRVAQADTARRPGESRDPF
jgi:hypothetical protein